MLDSKILDLARRLTEAGFAERREILPDKVNQIIQEMRDQGILDSNITVKLVRRACEEEVRKKAEIALKCLQKAHRAFCAPVTVTLATDLKDEIGRHIEAVVKEASELTSKRLRPMKPNSHPVDLESIEREMKQKFDAEVDIYVASLAHSANAGNGGKEDIAGFLSVAELARHHGVETEALRKRLDRHREKHALDTDLFVESQNRGKNKPKYLYSAEKVLPIIKELKKKEASIKRPS